MRVDNNYTLVMGWIEQFERVLNLYKTEIWTKYDLMLYITKFQQFLYKEWKELGVPQDHIQVIEYVVTLMLIYLGQSEGMQLRNVEAGILYARHVLENEYDN